TWSSASFLTSTLHGLLGVKVNGVGRELHFAPHLPPWWPAVSLRRLRVADSSLTLRMSQLPDAIQLEVENDVPAVGLTFEPQLPLGATVESAEISGRSVAARTLNNPQDTHGSVQLILPSGHTSVMLRYAGGVAIMTAAPMPAVGDPTRALKIVGI